MFSPQKDLKELVLEVLKKDQMSISGVCRELAARGVKMHRLELAGYLKALADMQVLKEKDIKPAKVFSASVTRDRNLYELIGAVSSDMGRNPDDRATLAAYCLQKVFKRPIFQMEIQRCGLEGSVEGRRASAEERAEAKAILARMGYKVPNSDIPVVVEKDLEKQYMQVIAEVIIERFNMRSHTKETTQLKL